MDNMQLGSRQSLSVVSPEDVNLQPIAVYGTFGSRPFGYQPMLPTRDSNDTGIVRCSHCLLLPKGVSDIHEILAVSHPDLKPQRAWFYVREMDKIRQRLAERGHVDPVYRSWEVDEERAKLTLMDGSKVVWKLTSIYAGPALRLGVWAD